VQKTKTREQQAIPDNNNLIAKTAGSAVPVAQYYSYHLYLYHNYLSLTLFIVLSY